MFNKMATIITLRVISMTPAKMLIEHAVYVTADRTAHENLMQILIFLCEIIDDNRL